MSAQHQRLRATPACTRPTVTKLRYGRTALQRGDVALLLGLEDSSTSIACWAVILRLFTKLRTLSSSLS